MSMDTQAIHKALPRIPDFHSMPRTLVARKLSQEGRQETIDIRQKFLSLNSRPPNYRGKSWPQRQNSEELAKDPPSSAPAGFRVKDKSPRNHVIMCAINSRRESKKTNEERARQRVKHYVAKQIYKIPTCKRPEFFIRTQVDPSPAFPYPKGTLSTANCHFNYVAPKKYLEDNYDQVLRKSATEQSEAKALKSSVSEQRRNRIIEKLISANNPERINEVTNSPAEPSSNIGLIVTSIESNAIRKSPSRTPSTTQLNDTQDSNSSNVEENPSISQSLSAIQRSKTVAFSIPATNEDTSTLVGSQKVSSSYSPRSIMSNKYNNTFLTARSLPLKRRGLTSADIASAHARHHFIHPEWPSEFTSWARYSHPTTSEKYQYGFL